MDDSKHTEAPATETLHALLALIQELGLKLDEVEVTACGAQVFQQLVEEAQREAKTKSRQDKNEPRV